MIAKEKLKKEKLAESWKMQNQIVTTQRQSILNSLKVSNLSSYISKARSNIPVEQHRLSNPQNRGHGHGSKT